MSKNIHKAVSIISAPQLTPAYFFLALVLNNLRASVPQLVVALMFACIVPIIALLVYMRIAKVDLYVSDRAKRLPIFLATIMSYLMGLLFLSAMHAEFIVVALMMSFTINTTVAAIISMYDKVSVHVWSMSGPSVALLYQFGLTAFAVGLALSILVGYSRIRLGAHNVRQVATAVLVSVPLTILIIYYLAPLLV